MRAYFQRVHENSRLWERIWWAGFRLLMVYAVVRGFIDKPFDITNPLQAGANLAGMFAWEIFQALPAKNLFRHMPSFVQDGSVVLLFSASFCGKFLDFYYKVRLWDSVLHTLCGGLMVLLGYEVVVCMQKRDKKAVSVPVALLCAFGFSFFVSTMWELFEFTFDQVSLLGGGVGDAQHWSYALAEGTAKLDTLIDPVDPARWPLMDTMGDIVLNTVGAFAAYIVLKIYPYRHKGKNNVNELVYDM